MALAAAERAARAATRRAQRVVQDHDRHPVMAEVLSTSPLRVQIHGRDVVLTRGQTLTLSRLLRAELARAHSAKLAVGDTLLVRELANHEWVAFDWLGAFGTDDSANADIYDNLPDPPSPNPLASDVLQAGVVSGGDLTWLSLTSVRLAAGLAFVPDAAGVPKRVSWPQTDFTGMLAPDGGSGYSRLDQVVVDATGVPSIQYGTTGTGVSLASRTGANDSGIGAGKLRLYDMLSSSSGGGVGGTASIRSRIVWARGAYANRTLISGGNYTLTTTGAGTPFPAIDPINLSVRVEAPVGGAEFELGFSALWFSQVGYPWFGWLIDGVVTQIPYVHAAPAASIRVGVKTPVFLGGGSHLIQPAWSVDRASSDSVISRVTTSPLYFWVEEKVGRINNWNGVS